MIPSNVPFSNESPVKINSWKLIISILSDLPFIWNDFFSNFLILVLPIVIDCKLTKLSIALDLTVRNLSELSINDCNFDWLASIGLIAFDGIWSTSKPTANVCNLLIELNNFQTW